MINLNPFKNIVKDNKETLQEIGYNILSKLIKEKKITLIIEDKK